MLKPVPFGKYYLLERINVGGMAEVFKAKAFGVEGFERLFAVKKILPSIAADQDFIRMFIDEAKIAVQLNHANIAQIFDLGKVDGAYFIALEYVSGKDLRTIFEQARAKDKPWSIPQACHVVRQVCEGLDYAHNKKDSHGAALNIVHRDVSPQNILVSYEGEVKIIDFGIAKAAGRASKTQAGILKGKFGYMSPEQVRGLPLDRRSDIFSLGIILYELLTMQRLFYAESDFSILEKIRNVEIPPIRERNPEVPEELERIVMKALARDPDARYQSAAQFHDALHEFSFSSGHLFTRKDLAAYMHEMFHEDILLEQAKLEEYRKLPPPPDALAAQGEVQRAPGDEGWSMNGTGPFTAPNLVTTGNRPTVLPPTPPGQTPDLPLSFDRSGVAPNPGSPPPLPGGQATEGWSMGGTPAPRDASNTPGGGLEWDDDEVPTTVYEKSRSASNPALDPELDGLDVSDADIVYAAPKPPVPVQPPMPPAPVEQKGGSWRAPLLFLAAFTGLALLGALVVVYVALRVMSNTIDLETLPRDGVSVYVDGELLHQGATPVEIKGLFAGKHKLVVEKEGYEDGVRELDLRRGEARSVVVYLTPSQRVKAVVSVGSEPPGARVVVDGREQSGSTPLVVTGLEPGEHVIEVGLPGYEPWKEKLEIKPGERLEIVAALKPKPVTLVLDTVPSQARYRLSGVPGKPPLEGHTPATITDLPRGGQVEVTLEKPGYQPRTVTLELLPQAGSQELTKTISLTRQEARAHRRPPVTRAGTRRVGRRPERQPERQPERVPSKEPARRAGPSQPKPATAQGPGFLWLLARPQAQVWIDGRYISWTPVRQLQLSAGPHVVELGKPGMPSRKRFTVTIQPGRQTKVIKKAWATP